MPVLYRSAIEDATLMLYPIHFILYAFLLCRMRPRSGQMLKNCTIEHYISDSMIRIFSFFLADGLYVIHFLWNILIANN